MKTVSDFTKGCYTRLWKRRNAILVDTENRRCAAMMAAKRLGLAATSHKLSGVGFEIRLKD